MIITSSRRSHVTVTPVSDAVAEPLRNLARDPNQALAIEPELFDSASFGALGTAVGGIGAAPRLLTISASELAGAGANDAADAATRTAAQQKALDGLVKGSAKAVQSVIPAIDPVTDGIEILIATRAAARSWADPDRTSVIKPSIDTAIAVFEAVEALAPYLPVVKSHKGLVDGVTTVLSLGSSVYEVYAAYSDD